MDIKLLVQSAADVVHRTVQEWTMGLITVFISFLFLPIPFTETASCLVIMLLTENIQFTVCSRWQYQFSYWTGNRTPDDPQSAPYIIHVLRVLTRLTQQDSTRHSMPQSPNYVNKNSFLFSSSVEIRSFLQRHSLSNLLFSGLFTANRK